MVAMTTTAWCQEREGGEKKVLVPGTLLVLNKTDLINIWRILHMQVICIKPWIYDKSNHIWLRIVFNKQSKCCKMLLTAPWLTPLVCANKNLHTDCLCFFSPSVHVASKNKNARYWTINNWQGCCRIRKTSDFYKVKGSCKHPVGGYFFLLLTLWEAVLNPGHASIKTYSHSEYLTFVFI